MLKVSIEYKNFNDVPVKEDWFFHMSETELSLMQARYPGGLEGYTGTLIMNNETGKMADLFSELIQISAGQKSSDGTMLVKSQSVKDKLLYSGAFNAIFLKLSKDQEFVKKFMAEAIFSTIDQDKLKTILDKAFEQNQE